MRRRDELQSRRLTAPVVSTATYPYPAPERVPPTFCTPNYPRPLPYTSHYQPPVPYYNQYPLQVDPHMYYQPSPTPSISYSTPLAQEANYQTVLSTAPETRAVQPPAKPLSLKEKFELSGIVKKDVEDKTQTRDPRIKSRGKSP
eukprot:TRINITY_DN72_c0_g1_i5.p3 TRINITY_DN72_c0_g1~~TRINITY_DN72_c0_g1_i5.p3  ORF type:complete len:144 (-),score=8.18 TRINITY_DN72_c0_g1_i5:164-595(-)